MKKAVALLLALSMVFAICGCGDSQKKDYEKAVSLFDEGSYEEAQAIFEELGDYEDSSSYVEKCKIEAKYAIKNIMSEDEFRDLCIEVDYAELLRNTYKYVNQCIKFKCKVSQLKSEINNEMESTCFTRPSSLRYIGYIDDPIHISYKYTNEYESRIIEGDIITIYGIFDGNYEFHSLGGVRNVPSITVLYYDYIRHV